MDVLEGNSMAAAVTPHACGTDGTGTCDGAGCGVHASGYGPGKATIDTTKSFTVSMAVSGSGKGVTTTLSQGKGSKLVIAHNAAECGSGYVDGLASSWGHMVITASNWGGDGDGMAWLDGDACASSISCNQGTMVLSDLRLDSLGNGTNSNDDDYEPWNLPWWTDTHGHAWWVWLVAGLSLCCLGVVLPFCLCRALWRCLCPSRDRFCDRNAGKPSSSTASNDPPTPPRPNRRAREGQRGAQREAKQPSSRGLSEPLLGGPRDSRNKGRQAPSARGSSGKFEPRHGGSGRGATSGAKGAGSAEEAAAAKKSRSWW
jgi:hypothetical protein